MCEYLVKIYIPTDEVGPMGPTEPRNGLLEAGVVQFWVSASERGFKGVLEYRFFMRPIDLDADDVLIAELCQPLDGRELKVALGSSVSVHWSAVFTSFSISFKRSSPETSGGRSVSRRLLNALV